MNWSAWLPAIITLIGALFTAGQLVGRIKNQEIVISKHDGRLDAHDEKLDSHASRLDRAEAWREGYNAACKAD